MDENIRRIIEELTPRFRGLVEGKHALALAGAHAKGTADALSDLDFFLLAEDMKDSATIEAVIGDIADGGRVTYWGGGVDFPYRGVPVETTIRILRDVDRVVEECCAGVIRIEPEFWTINGHYNYVHLAEIDFLKAVDDPHGIIAGLKSRLTRYPPALKAAAIDLFWPRCTFWTDNFHYDSAIQRADIIYTSGIIHNTFHSIVQLLFALNEAYFCGDKKIERQLGHLAWCPESLLENIELLMTTKRDSEFLGAQRAALRRINGELKERIDEITKQSL